MPLLEVSNLSKQYSGVAALKDVTLCADAGEIHAIIGANGAGKSTLMNLLSGVTSPSGGTISLAGEAVRFSSPQAAQAAGVRFHFGDAVEQLHVDAGRARVGIPVRFVPRSRP
jgi:ABC-type sugar transport system ATPase subunit